MCSGYVQRFQCSIFINKSNYNLHHLSFFLFLWQFPWKEMQVLPVQWHALCLGLFASIIAPFGGFFASGFKRAFKIKVLVFWYNLLFFICQKWCRMHINSYMYMLFSLSLSICYRILVIVFLDMVEWQIEWIARLVMQNITKCLEIDFNTHVYAGEQLLCTNSMSNVNLLSKFPSPSSWHLFLHI